MCVVCVCLCESVNAQWVFNLYDSLFLEFSDRKSVV